MEGRRLYVDGLNLFQSATSGRWRLQKTFGAIAMFMHAAHVSGYTVHVFIDAFTGDPESETSQKWVQRREGQLKRGERKVPQGGNILIGDMFRECGAVVHYSLSHSNDDTLAAFAWMDEALILSNDSDFLRYCINAEQRCFERRLFNSYTCENWPHLILNPLVLDQCLLNKIEAKARLDIVLERPITRDFGPCLVNLQDHLYIRGLSSACVKELGNIHGYAAVVHLRRALLAQLGISNRVCVQYPEWNQQEEVPMWHKSWETPLQDLACFSKAHLEHAFRQCVEETMTCWDVSRVKNQSQLLNHLFACRAIVSELWLLGWSHSRKSDFLFRMMAFEKSVDHALKIFHDNKKTSPSNIDLCQAVQQALPFEMRQYATGYVVKLMEGKSFGFLQVDGPSSSEQVFFHYQDLLFPQTCLHEGLRVRFCVCRPNGGKWCAFAIQ